MQVPPQKIRGGVVGGEPVGVGQKIVDLVGKNELIEFHALFAEGVHERDGFAEGHVAVIVAVNQQNG
jgi:hypothetical protein